QALGYTKKQLINRIITESLLVIVGGWVLGCIAAYLMLTTVDLVVMHPRAFAIDRFDPMAYKYTVPVPIAIMATAIYTIIHRLRKFDPVGVVERRLV
ncbi:MAG: FtsX-like permease family protein, partial [Armatimonadetes bacterium]|nr:FtsX-like permease family protein [Armatimonadota bacterium]